MSFYNLASSDPYYDDFNDTNNYHRILFRPGRAVQARELTQSQTILQDQITKFADNIFKQNSPVSGGQITTNFNCYYIKLQPTYNNVAIDVTNWYNATTNEGVLIRNADGSVIARVIQALPASGSNPATLVVSYKSGNQFQDGQVIYDVNSNMAAQSIASGSTGLSSVASIDSGVFYILGNFVQIQPSTVVIDAYDNSPSRRIGLTITETIRDYIDDPTLLDPAVGASNYQAPGADRYYIGLTLDTRPISFGDDQNFVELARVLDGDVQKLVSGSVYNVIDDYFAKRDYETNGDYVVNDFKLTPKTNVDSDKYTMSIGKGLAYVHGYRVENATPIDLVGNRARSTANLVNTPVSIDYGPYFYVDTVQGGTSSFFNIGIPQTVDLHCVDSAYVNTAAAAYNTTVVGTGYIRGLVYDQSTNDASGNTYIYRAYVHNITNKTPTANALGGSANTITLPATYSSSNTSYVGVNISLTAGPSAGDFRTITSYNGVTKVATVNQNWTTTPTTNSIFALNFDIKDIDSLVSIDGSYNITGKASINNASGRVNGSTVLENAKYPELVFNVGSPYIKSLVNTAYTTQQVFTNISFQSYSGGVQATVSIPSGVSNYMRHLGTANHTLSSDLVKQNFIIINKTTGQIVNWVESGRTVSLNSDATIATFTATSATGLTSPFNAVVIAKLYIETADNASYILKYKNLVNANTTAILNAGSGTNVNTYSYVDNYSGQVYIQNAGLLAPGQKQSLYLSDVKQVVKIIDTLSPGNIPTTAMLTGVAYDVTNNYTFDDGQRDTYYDHASITLKPGAPVPKGNILVLVNYYEHSGGDGYFSVNSYLNSPNPESSLMNIPTYRASSGIIYSLRDAVDFRPVRKNAQTTFDYQYSGAASAIVGVLGPVDQSIFTCTSTYYLGRRDKLVLSKDKSFQIIEGAPSLTPLPPAQPDGSLVIANLTHDPYTGYIPTETPMGVTTNLSIEKVLHKRYTMEDIANIEKRINNIEYYASLNLLEQQASSLQIADAYGLNRFKNGLLVDDFSSYGTADTYNIDYAATINRRDKTMTATQQVKNFPLKSLALNYSLGNLANTVSLGYGVNTDGHVNYFSLPYTTSNVASQKFASRTVNVNPFSFTTQEGVMSITPNVDNWVDTNYAPSILITDPNLQVYQSSNTINVLQAGDWKTAVGTTTQYLTNHTSEDWGYGTGVGMKTVSTTYNVLNTTTYGAYTNIGNTYSLNNGYITDISILPYIRPQQIVVRGHGMLFNTTVNSYFDGQNVDAYFHKGNILELTGVTGTFKEDDVIGYPTGTNSFVATARVLGVYNKGSGNVRLYVAADSYSPTYTTSTTVMSGNFNASGQYVNSSASGTLASTSHFGGRLTNIVSSSSVTLSSLASTTTGYYVGNTIYINAGTGVGQSATITAYYGANQTAVLSSTITAANTDVYSIGTITTDATGSVYGVFNLPGNAFHTGQRVFRIDNSGGNPGAATTYSQSNFYAEGLQTTQQGLDFGASPAGAKNTLTVSSKRTTTAFANSAWDPIAQTFIVDVNNYPNGLFLDSVSFFFRTKPTADNSPITLSIVGTLNGYPNGDTLDHSVVTKTPDEIVISETPQYLDATTKTTFKFKAPIYIQPGVLYAFVMKSNSKEYVLWSASNGDTALLSSTKNYPSDPTPAIATKIGSAPYVGGLFLSQNSQTWSVDQNQSLMFVLDRCVFNTSSTPTITYTIPKKLPQRTLYNQSLVYANNANNVSNTVDAVSNTDILVDAFNITTTDFVPTTTGISYSYTATLATGSTAQTININPGKFGTPTPDDIYLDDGNGERLLVQGSDTSFLLNATLSTTDNAVSPIISDAGLSTYSIKWNINNCSLSNSLITVVSGGTGYSDNASGNTTITISAPTGRNGTQAFGVANVSGGVIKNIYITTPGSGYVTTPTITVSDAGASPGSGAVISVAGETSKNGGNALARYVTKKVSLDQGLDSGDLNVFLSAYRPVNTDINVYYKILSRNDTQKFEDSSWQLMTAINNSGTKYSSNRQDVIEYSFAPGTSGADQGYVSYTSSSGITYTTFSQFAIKVVLTSTDPTSVPVVYDLRAIALPSNVNTSF